GAAPRLPREADRRGGGLRAGRLRRGREHRDAGRGRIADPPPLRHPERAERARAAGDRAALRADRRSAVHARGGREGVRRHARADPADREQHAEEARGPPRGPGAPRLRLAVRARSRHEEPAVRALEAAVALGAARDQAGAEALLAVRADDLGCVVGGWFLGHALTVAVGAQATVTDSIRTSS